MSEVTLAQPVELSDAELDLVTGGQAGAAGGLANVALNVEQIDILRNANFNIPVDVTIRNVANNNHVGVGAIVSALGGPAAILGPLA